MPGSSTQNNFNFNQWDTWASTVSKNNRVKVFLGVPGNTRAGRGYVTPENLAPIIQDSRKKNSFGGVMIWDASQAYINGDFLGAVKGNLVKAAAKEQVKAPACQRPLSYASSFKS